jgi:hypothetical protein
MRRGHGEVPPDLSSAIEPARRRGKQRRAQYRAAPRGAGGPPKPRSGSAEHRLTD